MAPESRYKMNLGNVLVELRKRRNITQEELAKEMGVSAAAVSKWEKNYSMPDIQMLSALADYFDISTDELLGRKGYIKKVRNQENSEKQRISAVITMRGGCRDAIDFYQDVFDAELVRKTRFEEAEELASVMKEDLKDCIYRAELIIRLSKKSLSIIMGDSPSILFASSLATAVSGARTVLASPVVQTGSANNVQFEIQDEDEVWLGEVFAKLSVGGMLNYDLNPKPPYKLFGSVIDRFGVCWTLQKE